jgi:hypothetical protein
LAKVKHLAECGGEEGEGFDCTPEIGEEGDDTFMLNLRNNDAHFKHRDLTARLDMTWRV